MLEREILCSEDYLHIPVLPFGPRRALQIWCEGRLLHEFYMAITDSKDCSYYFLSVKQLRGKTAVLRLTVPEGVTEQALKAVVCGGSATPDNPLYPGLYREKYRPQYHFSTKRGWLNDPNGLLYADGKFHMYYQHNPMGVPHGSVNVSWGHAVSDDLVFWQELDEAIMPWRRDWLIASGSALQDTENAAGCGKNAIVAAFTVLGTYKPETGGGYPSGGQFMAASTDGGNTFVRFSDKADVPAGGGEGWRDPRIFRYKDRYVMAVYETYDGHNCVSFYNSTDLRNWTRTSRNMDLYECPDLFELAVPGESRTKWVLYGGDGIARIGDFDGERFVESGEVCPLDYGHTTYAGQTWNHHPQGKRIHISWVRCMGGLGENTGYEGMAFSQCMTLPCELTLQNSPDGLRVCRRPIEQLERLRNSEAVQWQKSVCFEDGFPLQQQSEYRLSFTELQGKLKLFVREYEIQFDPATRRLSFDSGYACTLSGESLSFRMFVDTTTVELFFDEGISASYAMYPEQMQFLIRGGAALDAQMWSLKPIWN